MPKLPRTIALDGPASSGKTSVGQGIARALGYLFVDTGAFYRAVTLAVIRNHALKRSPLEIVELAEGLSLDITDNQLGDKHDYTVMLNGEDVTQAIRTPEVERHVSFISAISGVRDVLNRRYRELTAIHPMVIMAGRDIGTVVLPDADLKIYIDASAHTRALRRYLQMKEIGINADLDKLRDDLERRDLMDSQRAIAPLTRAEDAHIVNTDHLNQAQVQHAMLEIITAWQAKHP